MLKLCADETKGMSMWAHRLGDRSARKERERCLYVLPCPYLLSVSGDCMVGWVVVKGEEERPVLTV